LQWIAWHGAYGPGFTREKTLAALKCLKEKGARLGPCMVWRGREYLQRWGESLREDLPQLRKRILEYIAEEGAFTRSYVDAWDLVNESTPEIYPEARLILTHDITTTSSGEESSKYPYRFLFRQRSFPTTRFPNRRRNMGGAMRIRSCLEEKGRGVTRLLARTKGNVLPVGQDVSRYVFVGTAVVLDLDAVTGEGVVGEDKVIPTQDHAAAVVGDAAAGDRVVAHVPLNEETRPLVVADGEPG